MTAWKVQVKCVLVLMICTALNAKGETLTKQAQQQIHELLPGLKAAAIPSSMIDDIFFNILSYYAPVDAESPQCRNDSIKYVEAALNNDLWALQMFDASSKLGSGSLDGNFQGLGSYDACISIDSPENFTGQLCTVEVEGIHIPVLEQLKSKGDEFVNIIQPINPFMSMCVPSSCSYKDVETHMNVALQPLNASAKVNIRSCSTRYPEQWETRDYIAVYIISGIIGLVILSTFYDYFFNVSSTGKNTSLFLSFSLRRNVKKLKIKQEANELPTINGLRFIAIIWIVIGHRNFSQFAIPIFSMSVAESYLMYWVMAPLQNLMLAVEIFLLLSGFLVCYNFLKSMEERKTFNVAKFYFHRYMRITPVYVAMILLDGSLLYFMSDGPFWKRLTGVHRDMCSDWLPNILYISNYYYSTFKTCVPQTWYLCADMQLFFLSPLLLIPLHKKPKLGISLTFGCMVATTLATYFNANYYGMKAGGAVSVNRRNLNNLNHEYTQTHVRSVSYFIGLALGYFVYKYKQGLMKVNLSKITLTFGWLVSTILIFSVIFSVQIFQNPDFNPPQIVDSLYLSLHRPLFSLGIAWIIFVGITGYGGILNKILSLPVFKPLAILTYGIYMTHMSVQVYDLSRSRLPLNYVLFDVISNGIADLLISLFCSFILYLMVEAPFVEIDKWLFSKDGGKKEDSSTLTLASTEKTYL